MNKKPNILIVMTDHQRGDTVLPEHPAKTPNVAKLASEGLTFSNTFCPTAHCCPARATFHSGLYPSRHGIWNNVCNGQAINKGLKQGVRLWSEDLAENGYSMHFSGKWHVSSEESPKDRGWHEHLVSGTAAEHHGKRWEDFKSVASLPEQAVRGDGEILRPGYSTYTLYKTLDEVKKNSHDEKVVAESLSILDDVSKGDKPWCLFVGLIGPHDPYNVPRKYVDMYDLDDIQLPKSYHDELFEKPYVYRKMRDMRFGQLSSREVREAIRHFYAYCTYLDEMFGKILGKLDDLGQKDDTLVLYVSDHGDYCGDHGLFAKGVPAFRGAYHVPAVVRWPNGLKSHGGRIDKFVSLADFAPTFLEVAGVKTERTFTGRSLYPFFEGIVPTDWRDDMHSQFNGVELYYTQRAVMTDNFLFVYNGFDRDELYNLKSDPDEMVNLAEEPGYMEVKRQMCRRMWRFACREDDQATNPYITTSLAPFGPAEAFRK